MGDDFDKLLEARIERVVRKVLAERPANDSTPEYVTVAAYARARSISEGTVREAIRENRLEHMRIGRAVRVKADASIGERATTLNDQAILKLMRGGRVR